MADLDFMGYRRVIFKSVQEPSIVALCDAVKNGWHGEIVPEASPKRESKSNREVERAVQSVLENGLAFYQDLDEVGKTQVDWERGNVHCVLIQHLENLLNQSYN